MSAKEYKAPIDAPDTKEAFDAFMKARHPDIPTADLEKAWAVHANKDLTSRIVDTMNVYGETLVKDMQERFAEMVQLKVKEQEQAIVQGIMEGLGIDTNPVAKISDVETIVRKIMVENGVAGRKSAGGGGGASPEGDDDDDTEEKSFAPFDFKARMAKDLGVNQ